MTKAQLIDRAAKLADMTKKDITLALDALLKTAEDTLVAGEQVQISGFVTVTVKERAARVGRNPKTGAEVQIPASRTLNFVASKTLKEKLN